MGELVFIDNGKVVTDSLMVAEVFKKDHRHVLRDIENQMEKLVEANERDFGASNFGLTSYQHEQNKQHYKKYNLTEDAFAIIAMAYTTSEAMKFKVKFLQEFKRIKEELTKPKVLTDKEQLIASMKLSIETSEELSIVKTEVDELKKKMSEYITLGHGEQQVLHHEIKRRVEEYASANGISDKEKRQLYSQIHSHLRRAFASPSYRVVKKTDFEDAISWVKAWRPLI